MIRLTTFGLTLTLLLLTFRFPETAPAQQEPFLTPGPTTQLPQASIWGGISYNGENISITTVLMQNRPQLFLRKMDRELQPLGLPIQLTFDSDPESLKRITDHKHLFLNGFHYITFSVGGDSDLYLMKLDKEGRRVGSIEPVVENTTDRTNDMMFTTDGERLFVAFFKPNEQSTVHILDENLRPLQPPLTTSLQLPHNNLGGMTYHEGRFYMFTGDKAGPNSNLILTVWNRDWAPALAQRKVLISAPSGGGYFFATGIVFDPVSRLWYLGFHHVQNVNPDENTHIDTAVFDESFRLLEHQHGEAGFRPHFLLLDNYLYMVFDRGGVFLKRFTVRRSGATGAAGSVLTFPIVIRTPVKDTGIALVNTAENSARLAAEAYADNGNLIALPGVANPTNITLPPQAQAARLIGELFGNGFQTDGGWARISTNQSGLLGFFLTFDPAVETLDGAVAGDKPNAYWVVPAFEGAEVSLVNPNNDQEADLTLRWIDPQGRVAGLTLTSNLAPRSRRTFALQSLLPKGFPIQGYVQGTTYSGGIFSCMRFGQAGVHESMLNALDANSGGMRLFAPQYVTGDDYRSSMAVINLEEAATMLTVEILDSQGRLITAPTQARLPARGSAIVDEAALFGTQPARRVEGYARITSSASRITGAVFFGDSAGTRFRTALPMITEGVTEAVFPHLAEDSGYFTGVAAVNLSAQAATVTVSAYDPAGQPLGAGTQTLAGGNRFSLLLRELIPSIPPVSRGYFQLRSNQPLASFAVFGTRNLSALSALPAQPRARTPFYGAAKDEDYLRINADSDFVPPRGGIPGGPGPAMVRLMVARSKDGLNFERDGKIVCDQGAVPDMVVDRAGTVYLYYTAWTVGSEINKTVVAISKDRGASWTFRKLNLPRQQGESDLVDPDVLILDDGSFRLYTTIGQGGQYARTHRLDSRDGLVFERKGVAFDPGQQALDPSTIKIGNTYHLFAGGGSGPETNWHGTSPDGAVYTFDKMMTFRFNNFGQMMANGLAVDGGYRFYCFGNDRKGGITSFFTTDGNTWTADAGYRLSAVSNSPLEDGQPTDPAIGRLSDGTYLLIYSIRIKSQ